MKYKIIPIMLVCFLLVSTMFLVTAKQVDKLDWKTNKLTIKEDGVYNNHVKVKDKDKSEIWIEKHEKKNNELQEEVYHIDSLVEEDTEVIVELYYEIQPDTIFYESHTGKYQEYVTWDWTDKVCANESEYCGGYATIESTLEYGLGSNTYTSAILVATWKDDGIDITLTENTDYTLSGDVFTIINNNYAWNNIDTAYDYNADLNTSNSLVLHLIELFIGISFIALIYVYIKNEIGGF